jgi:hypothetical protein
MAAAIARNIALGSYASMASLVLPAGVDSQWLAHRHGIRRPAGHGSGDSGAWTIARKSAGADSSAEDLVPFEAAAKTCARWPSRNSGVLAFTSRKPKNRGPFHVVPVMARAMLERLRWGLPFPESPRPSP